MTIEDQATERVLKARAELIMARRFYGVLVSNVEPVLSRKFPTMATDGKRHFFNPEFISGLTQQELLGVQCHESEHDARHHGSRREGRDPVKWNEACDYAINIDLIDEGFVLPKGALIDPQYRGMSAEDIYRCRELDAEKKRKEEQQQQEQQQNDDDGDDDDGDQSDKDEGGDDKGDEDDDDADDGDGESDADDGDQDGDDGEGGDADGDDGEQDADGGSGGGDGENAEGDDDGSGAGGGEGEGESEQQSSGDPGGCGEVLDSATDASDNAEEDIKWERVTRQAASMAKAVGQLPGHVAREIDRANNPPRDWRDELREFAEQGALRVETWNRPNRRFMHSRLVLPSTQKDGVNKGVFIIDTSGSCDDIALACVNAEATALLDDGVIDEIVVLYGDTRLTREDVYRTGDEMIFDPRGGGGTDMEPLFSHVAEHHDDASLIVCFTDLEFYKSCGPEPHCPVLFAVHGYPQNVKRLIETAPWGARGIDVGAH
jgi:predicted metal-dependent peptidase